MRARIAHLILNYAFVPTAEHLRCAGEQPGPEYLCIYVSCRKVAATLRRENWRVLTSERASKSHSVLPSGVGLLNIGVGDANLVPFSR